MSSRVLPRSLLVLLVIVVSALAPLSANAASETPTHPACFRWESVASPVADLMDVDVISANDAWAVGANGAILHWNGSQWAVVPAPTSERLTGISMVPTAPGQGPAVDGWAVGWSNTVLRWQGGRWMPVSIDCPWCSWGSVTVLSSVDAQGRRTVDGWATGFPGLMRLQDDTWTLDPSASGYYVSDVDLVAPDAAMLLLENYSGVMHWNGVEWTFQPLPQPSGGALMWSLDMVSAEDAWTVGQAGVFTWDGVSWATVFDGRAGFTDVDPLGPDQVWFAGTERMGYWDGVTFWSHSKPAGASPWKIAMVPAPPGKTVTDGWAVGSTGILRYRSIGCVLTHIPLILR